MHLNFDKWISECGMPFNAVVCTIKFFFRFHFNRLMCAQRSSYAFRDAINDRWLNHVIMPKWIGMTIVATVRPVKMFIYDIIRHTAYATNLQRIQIGTSYMLSIIYFVYVHTYKSTHMHMPCDCLLGWKAIHSIARTYTNMYYICKYVREQSRKRHSPVQPVQRTNALKHTMRLIDSSRYTMYMCDTIFHAFVNKLWCRVRWHALWLVGWSEAILKVQPMITPILNISMPPRKSACTSSYRILD